MHIHRHSRIQMPEPLAPHICLEIVFTHILWHQNILGSHVLPTQISSNRTHISSTSVSFLPYIHSNPSPPPLTLTERTPNHQPPHHHHLRRWSASVNFMYNKWENVQLGEKTLAGKWIRSWGHWACRRRRCRRSKENYTLRSHIDTKSVRIWVSTSFSIDGKYIVYAQCVWGWWQYVCV